MGRPNVVAFIPCRFRAGRRGEKEMDPREIKTDVAIWWISKRWMCNGHSRKSVGRQNLCDKLYGAHIRRWQWLLVVCVMNLPICNKKKDGQKWDASHVLWGLRSHLIAEQPGNLPFDILLGLTPIHATRLSRIVIPREWMHSKRNCRGLNSAIRIYMVWWSCRIEINANGLFVCRHIGSVSHNQCARTTSSPRSTGLWAWHLLYRNVAICWKLGDDRNHQVIASQQWILHYVLLRKRMSNLKALGMCVSPPGLISMEFAWNRKLASKCVPQIAARNRCWITHLVRGR